MTGEILGGGDVIYAALEHGADVVPDGPLKGLPLHVPRANPEWVLPESYRHVTNDFTDDEEISLLVAKSYEETQKTGAIFVPSEIFDLFYERAKQDENGGSTAAFEVSYVIKGLSYFLPYQIQRVIELNNARAIMGSYRQSDIGRHFRSTLVDNFNPLNLRELFNFFDGINSKFKDRKDTSEIGTTAFIDEADRLVQQVMNLRWSTIALPRGDDTYVAPEESKVENGIISPTYDEVLAARDDFVAAIGSERILAWDIGSTLQNLGSYVTGLATFSGENNPFNELRAELVQRIKKVSKAEEKVEIRELLQQLQDLGHLQSQYSRSK